MVAPRVAGRAGLAAVTAMPLVLMAGMNGVRYTLAPEMLAIWAAPVTGPIRETMPSAVAGSSACWPEAVLAGCTVSRLASWPSSASSPDSEELEMPSTPTMAAMPMLMPSADSPARTRRVRSPRLATRSRSRPVSRDPSASRARCSVMDDLSVADLDPPVHRAGDVPVVGDDGDGGAVGVQFAQQV